MGGNPWLGIGNADYERHMGHTNVGQLKVLSTIARDQLDLVGGMVRPKVVILGVANGNGLEHIDKMRCGSVVGIDISSELMDVCRRRYSRLLPVLRLHQLDIVSQRRQVIDLLGDADLITANLLVEHIHLDNFIGVVRELNGPLLSVTVQVNPDGCLVSRSGHEGAFNEVVKHAQECDEGALVRSLDDVGYHLAGRAAYDLPNDKLFVRLDFRRSGHQ